MKNILKYKSIYRLILWAAITSIIIPFLALFLCLFLASQGVWGELPNFQELENPQTNLATEIISADNKLLGKYFYENRTHVEFEDLSPDLISALIATEDERFFQHAGIDFIALFRVAKGIVTGNSNLGGVRVVTR